MVVVAPEQVAGDLRGEIVILNLRADMYYGLNEVGAMVWRLIQEPRTVTAICAALLAEYDVEPDRCRQDVLALLGDLAAAGMIVVGEAPGA